jgi:hypothetical protein
LILPIVIAISFIQKDWLLKKEEKKEKKERSNHVLLKEFQSFQIKGGILSLKEQV